MFNDLLIRTATYILTVVASEMKHELDITEELCEECEAYGHAQCDFCASVLCEEHAKRVAGTKTLVACEYCSEQHKDADVQKVAA